MITHDGLVGEFKLEIGDRKVPKHVGRKRWVSSPWCGLNGGVEKEQTRQGWRTPREHKSS